MIKNKSSLLPLYGNVINLFTPENKKLFSYKNIFNKNILWVKLYDNYLYLYLNKNTNNKFNLFEPKTKINTVSAKAATSLAPGLPAYALATAKACQVTLISDPYASNEVSGAGNQEKENHSLAISSSLALANKTDDNKIQINKNTIKLLNSNNRAAEQEVKKEIKLYNYLNTISEYKNETVKYQNIVYQFNKNSKGIQNSSVGVNKNVFTLLESTFLSMSSLISKPFIIITPNKVVIQLFYYLNKFYNSNKNSLIPQATMVDSTNNKLLNINNDKLQLLCLNLSKIYKKPVELELDRLHYPYYDSNILSNMIGLISNIVKLRFIINKLFTIAKIKKTNKFSNKSSIIPSYLSGFKIRVAGRLLTQRVIPRLTVKTMQRGTLARGKAKFVDSARFSNKNKRGSFSITVTMGHVFF